MKTALDTQDVRRRIHVIRGQRVILDSDLAEYYEVTTKQFNQAIKRNSKRFPEDFSFQITPQEFEALKSQTVTSKHIRGGRRKMPWAFTEHGAIMAAGVLNSPTAIQMSVAIIRAFVQMRELVSKHREIEEKLSQIERTLESHDTAIRNIFEAIRQLLVPVEPSDRRKIGFHEGNR